VVCWWGPRQTVEQARQSLAAPTVIGNELFGVKWRNWKLFLKEIDEDSYAIRNMAYPTIYNLFVDPKEEVPELNYLPNRISSFTSTTGHCFPVHCSGG
jgi:hypothetical protein